MTDYEDIYEISECVECGVLFEYEPANPNFPVKRVYCHRCIDNMRDKYLAERKVLRLVRPLHQH